MSIEKAFDVAFVARLALKEKQIQQNYRPIIAVHKWFARRPGTLFRSLLLSEFGRGPLAESFFRANDFPNLTICDPFMGGGTPLLEANRIGCDVVGGDINPMSAWIVREEIDHLDRPAYLRAAEGLRDRLETQIGTYYRTRCTECGADDARVKYFLWVKVQSCAGCTRDFDLFPGFLLAKDRRHPRTVLVCPQCGELNEVGDIAQPGACSACTEPLRVDGPAKRNRCTCPHCGTINRFPAPESGPPRHRLFAIEYHCVRHSGQRRGRFFKRPDSTDRMNVEDAQRRWRSLQSRFVPDAEIPAGDETDRLHRWGYARYRDLFSERQLLALELSCRLIDEQDDPRISRALATNFSDLLRYQNMLCRYDTMALKSLDIFSVHGFPVGLVQCESNVLGIPRIGGGSVGSGGWTNIIEKYAKAKEYCERPFEVDLRQQRPRRVPVEGEWIGERWNGGRPRRVDIRCASATEYRLPADSVDAVLTDPPYFGNVQYAELMDFCYVWLRRLVGTRVDGFGQESTRSAMELTGNATHDRGLAHYADGLGRAFRAMAAALKPGAPLAFTFHHNRFDVYHAVGVAILDAGLTCSASLPCPAEMGGSIHIHGTESSILDTIFVCRTTGGTRRHWQFADIDELTTVVANDVDNLRAGGVQPTMGDVRCVIYGHLTRMTVWRLRGKWRRRHPTTEKLKRFMDAVSAFGDPTLVLARLGYETKPAAKRSRPSREPSAKSDPKNALSV